MTTAPAQEAAASDPSEKKTLFVKNLPEDATKEQLDLVFSEVGKLRHCFVVKKRHTEDFKGIGFVTFVDADSVKVALNREFKLGSNRLQVTIADDKKKHKDTSAKSRPKISFTKDAKQDRRLQKAKLIVRNLSFKATVAELEKAFGEFGKVLSVTIPKKDEKHIRGFAFVQFEKVAEAAKAVKALNAKDILGRPVAVDFAVAKKKFEEVRKSKVAAGKTADTKTSGKPSKEEDHGDSDSGPSEYGSDDDEEKPERNGTKASARKRSTANVNEESDDDSGSDEGTESDAEDSDEDEESGSEVEFGSDGEVRLVKRDQVKDKSRILGRTKSSGATGTDRKKLKSAEDEESGSEDEAMDSDDSDDEEDEEMDVDEDESDEDPQTVQANRKDKPETKQDKAKKKGKKDDSDSDSDWGHTPNDDSSEDEDEEDQEKAQRKREMIKKEDLSRTVFVKNISFDTTQTTFQERMKQFGPYKFCLLCMDKMLGRSKGTGFVKFEERADAARCVESLQAGEVTLDGKILSGTIAMKRDQLQEEMQKKITTKKQPKDKRNLYLAREGFIRGGTAVAAQMSEHDLKMRAKLESSKKKALKNLHNFVSDTRLCIHNLPPSCDDKQLRKIFAKVVDRQAKITEARVMRNMKRLGADGKGVSKGFGFVNFEKHEDALKALRAVNNNPKVFTDQMRPIVSFSIENRAALMVKERRLKNSQQKLQEIRQMKGPDHEGRSGGKGTDYQDCKRLPYEGLRAQVDMKTLPRRVGEKVRLDPKRRQHQLRLKRLAREARRKPEFKKKKEKRPKGLTKAQQKERLGETQLNQMIERHRQKMRRLDG